MFSNQNICQHPFYHPHISFFDLSCYTIGMICFIVVIVDVKSGSTSVGGPVKSGQRQTKEEGRGLDKRLVRPELVTAWIQRLRITSVDPLCRFQSR